MELDVKKPHDQHLLDLMCVGSVKLKPDELGSALYLMKHAKKTQAFNIEPIYGQPNNFRVSLNGHALKVNEGRSNGKRTVFEITDLIFG
jgi:hypothetical protein